MSEADLLAKIDVVSNILDAVTGLTGMGFVAVARVTRDTWTCCAVRDDLGLGIKLGDTLPIDETLCGFVRARNEMVVVSDVDLQADQNHDCLAPILSGFRSYFSVPIELIDGTVWGTLCAVDKSPRELDRKEITETLKLFGALVASQLELQSRVDRSDAALKTSRSNLARSERGRETVVGRLRASEAGRAAAEQSFFTSQSDLAEERETSLLREQFIGVLGHDLRNPLASIDAGLRVLLRDQSKASDIIPMIQRSVIRMAGLVDNIMDFARGRLGGELTIRTDANEPLAPIILQVVSEMRSAWPDAKIEATVDIDVPVRCDRGKIGQLISNLMGNAVTYGDPQKPIQLAARAVGNEFKLAVTNFGTPISEKAMAHLFQPYTRGERPSQQGLGLGLFIASEIARAHGGTLKATSTEAGTTFEFRMPLLS